MFLSFLSLQINLNHINSPTYLLIARASRAYRLKDACLSLLPFMLIARGPSAYFSCLVCFMMLLRWDFFVKQRKTQINLVFRSI